MTRTFVELPLFRSKWEKLGLTDLDFRRLQESLLADPKIGAVMQGTGGIRKMRFAFEYQGKSEGKFDKGRAQRAAQTDYSS